MNNELAELLLPNINKDTKYYEDKYPKRNLKEDALVTRFAPSPTGFVHMGSLFASFINSVYAKQSGGVFFLRIEDTDSLRKVENGTESILRDLKAFGIYPDEGVSIGGEYGPYIQSERTEIYQTYVKELIKKGYAYPCFLTSEEEKEIKEEQELEKKQIGIYGHYAIDRDLTIEEVKDKIKQGLSYVIRLKSTGNPNNYITFNDLIKGEIKFPENNLDYVLLKKDKTPTYHLAHIVDDHLMRTNCVIRGDEWLSSVPFHLQLSQVLGFTPNNYAHIAPITKKDNGKVRKLSKRLDPEAKVSYYDELGIPIEAVKLYLATIMNSNFEQWYLENNDKSITDFTFNFDKQAIGGTLFDIDKLNNISKTYFSRKSGEEVYQETLKYSKLFNIDYYNILLNNKDLMIKFLNIEKDGARPRKDITKYSDVKDEFSYAIDDIFYKEKYSKYDGNKIYDYSLVMKYLETLDLSVTNEVWFAGVKDFCLDNNYAINNKEYKANPNIYTGTISDFCEALRVIITGRTKTPDLFSIMQILGKEKIIARVDFYKKIVSK